MRHAGGGAGNECRTRRGYSTESAQTGDALLDPVGGLLHRPVLPKGVHNEAEDGDADTRVSDVKRRPGMREREVEVEEEEINDVAVQETVGEVAENPG